MSNERRYECSFSFVEQNTDYDKTTKTLHIILIVMCKGNKQKILLKMTMQVQFIVSNSETQQVLCCLV